MRTYLLSALALAATLSLVGCGGDDGDENNTTADTGGATEETGTDTGTLPTDTGSSTDDTGTATDTGSDTGTAMETGGDTATDAPASATWTQVYAIFSAGGKCTGCHGSSGGLNLSNKALAYEQLKLMAASPGACGSTMQLRVKPGDAANSLLLDKLAKPSAMVCGDRMPRGDMALPASDIDKVRSWINAGALNN